MHEDGRRISWEVEETVLTTYSHWSMRATNGTLQHQNTTALHHTGIGNQEMREQIFPYSPASAQASVMCEDRHPQETAAVFTRSAPDVLNSPPDAALHMWQMPGNRTQIPDSSKTPNRTSIYISSPDVRIKTYRGFIGQMR